MLSLNRNRVLRYLSEGRLPGKWPSVGNMILPVEGRSAYPFFSFRWGGLDPKNGNPIGYVNGEATTDYAKIRQNTTPADLVYHGSALPTCFGSLRQTLAWKNLSLSVNISYQAGYYFRRETINYEPLLSEDAEVAHVDYRQRWQQEGDEQHTTVPSLIYPANSWRDRLYKYAELTAERGDHIRLQDINFSYIITADKPTLLQHCGIKDLQLTLYARNVGILWRANKLGLDPEVQSNTPPGRMWSLGLTANF